MTIYKWQYDKRYKWLVPNIMIYYDQLRQIQKDTVPSQTCQMNPNDETAKG